MSESCPHCQAEKPRPSAGQYMCGTPVGAPDLQSQTCLVRVLREENAKLKAQAKEKVA